MRKRCLCWGKSTTYGLGEEGFLALHGYTSLSLKFLSRIRMVYGWLVQGAKKRERGGHKRECVCVCFVLVGWWC